MAYPINSKESKAPDRPSVSSPAKPVSNSGGGSWFRSLLTLIVVILLFGGGIYFITGYTGIASLLPGSSVFESEWQAVFLTNGQVYFGKVDSIHPDFIDLQNIYYLQIVNVEDTSALGQPPDVQAQPEQRLTLIKLGNEIHGPLDSMLINREHVVIIEDLKSDSRVVQAINDYINNQDQ